MECLFGGSWNTGQFQMSLENTSFRPNHTTFAIEGVMRPHFFPLKKTTTAFLSEPVSSFARVVNPFTGELEEYISVGLIGSEDGKKHREDLNLVVVLDISGSMNSPFNSLDTSNITTEDLRSDVKPYSKLDIAKNCLKKIFQNLRPNERFGLVLFDSNASCLQPLRTVGNGNEEIEHAKLMQKITEIRTRGSTNLYAGMKMAIDMLEERVSDDADNTKNDKIPKNNRILFLTDGLPNTGGEFEDMHSLATKAASKKFSIFTTFVGLGVDFGSDLVSKLTKIRGANYFTVDTEASFEKLLLEDFNYMVTPIGFNVNVFFESDCYEVEKSYGSQYDKNEFTSAEDLKNLPTNSSIIKLDTISASDIDPKKGVKGGVVLLKLKRKPTFQNTSNSKETVVIGISYENLKGKSFQHSTTVEIPNIEERIEEENEKVSEIGAQNEKVFSDYFEDLAVRKAVLLMRYFCLVKKLLINFGGTDGSLPDDKKQEVKAFQKWFKSEMEQYFEDDRKELMVHYDNLDRLKFT